jgi:hypothetical protein
MKMYTKVSNYVRSNSGELLSFTEVNKVIVLIGSVIKAIEIPVNGPRINYFYSCELSNNSVIIVDSEGAQALGITGIK